MAKALICDNCKKCFPIGEREDILMSDLILANHIEFSYIGVYGERYINHYDICPECAKKVLMALPNIIGSKEGHDEN